ncbi:MAG: LacI family DNA-binding transcriptional regulator [Microbacterium sp.]
MTSPPAGGRARRGGASIYDVAALAGVSHQTVSRVINAHPNIRAATRERVEAAMRETNYTPSSTARALATSRSRRIGVLIDSPIEYGPSSTMRGIEQAARAAGYTASAITVSDDAALDLDAGLTQVRIQDVDALCIVAARSSTLTGLRGVARELPTLLVKAERDGDIHTVAVDQHAGAVHAIDHLLGLGHRRILHVAGPADWTDARIRERAYTERISASGLEVIAPLRGDWTSDAGYRLGVDPDAIPHDVTAIFAANDQTALGLVHGLHARGIRVPEDVSVVGFDDVPDARHFLPPLTTVRQDFHALGTLAMTTLIAALEGTATDAFSLIEPELIVRSSTAAPRC